MKMIKDDQVGARRFLFCRRFVISDLKLNLNSNLKSDAFAFFGALLFEIEVDEGDRR